MNTCIFHLAIIPQFSISDNVLPHKMNKEDKELLLKVRLAETAERYDDMVKFVNELIKTGSNDVIDPSLVTHVSVAYKNAVGERRASWRSISIWKEEEGEAQEAEREAVQLYQKSIGFEVLYYCTQMLELVDKHLLPQFRGSDNEILLLKLTGDYCRYMAEVQSGNNRLESIKKADDAYDEAIKKCWGRVSPCDPVRLELALNHSVLNHDLKHDRQEACRIAKLAFEDALSKVDKEDGDRFINSTTTMQMIRDNLVQWTLSTDEKGD